MINQVCLAVARIDVSGQLIQVPKELDARISRLPFGPGLRQFKNGISDLSQISGSERKNMAKILLGCVHDLLPPDGVASICWLLDFIYLSQYSMHDMETLGYLTDALNNFHKNKDYFIKVGIHPDLNIPKLHSLSHYVESIELFGTTDNYNTEMFERLHIDFAKLGWRSSNQRDEFPQMIRWLSRQEKINCLQYLIALRSQNSPILASVTGRLPICLAKRPQFPQCQISVIEKVHYAPDIQFHLKKFLNTFVHPSLSARCLESTLLPISTLDVYTSFRFTRDSLDDNSVEDANIVKATPATTDNPSGRFDTVILLSNDIAESTALAGV